MRRVLARSFTLPISLGPLCVTVASASFATNAPHEAAPRPAVPCNGTVVGAGALPLQIVDGHDVMATVLHMYLRQPGYAPVVVTSAPRAVEALPTGSWIGVFLYLRTDEDERRARVALALPFRDERQVSVVRLTDDGLQEDELHGVLRLGRPLDTDALEGALRRFLPSPTNRPHRDRP